MNDRNQSTGVSTTPNWQVPSWRPHNLETVYLDENCQAMLRDVTAFLARFYHDSSFSKNDAIEVCIRSMHGDCFPMGVPEDNLTAPVLPENVRLVDSERG